AFLLIRGDPVPPPGAHSSKAQQRPGGVDQRLAAVIAHVDANGFRVQVATVAAAACAAGGQAVLARVGWWELGTEDLIAGALVVDPRAGAELANADEPGPLDVVAVAAAGQARDVSREWQPRERVAGQEPLGGEIPVGVKVGLEVSGVLIAQQAELDPG